MVVTPSQKNRNAIQAHRRAGTSSDSVLNRLAFDVRTGCTTSRNTSAQVTTRNAAIQTQYADSRPKKGKKKTRLPSIAIDAIKSTRQETESRGILRASSVKKNTTLLNRLRTKTSSPAK